MSGLNSLPKKGVIWSYLCGLLLQTGTSGEGVDNDLTKNNSLVNLMELQLYKILHFSCWCWGARTAQAEYRQDLHTLARKSLIITTMTRRASSKSAPLLSEHISRGL